ncbi:MAG: alpha/beta hydrolase [Rhodospirillaceae bacterium]|nr:alpha/beta hydrolase [Rhodospirillaceae bacterium]
MTTPTLPPNFAEAFTVPTTGGLELRVYRLQKAPDEAAPALIFAHANGFNAGCYQPFLRCLSAHFRVFAYDARGHGNSSRPLDNLEHDYAMVRFAEDLSAITARVRWMIGAEAALHFASHSLGGLAAVLMEAELDEAPFDSLTLFEPPIYPPDDHVERAAALEHAPIFIRWAAARRGTFPDRQALRAEMDKIITYRRFAPEMMEAYMDAAVEAGPDGGLALRCPGVIESAIYGNCPYSGIFEQTAAVTTRARIYATDQSVLPDLHSWAPGTMASIAANMAQAEARTMPGCLHLMVQEDPDACAAAVIDNALG